MYRHRCQSALEVPPAVLAVLLAIVPSLEAVVVLLELEAELAPDRQLFEGSQIEF